MSTFTADQVEAAIGQAVRERDMEAAADLIVYLARIAPERAAKIQQLLGALAIKPEHVTIKPTPNGGYSVECGRCGTGADLPAKFGPVTGEGLVHGFCVAHKSCRVVTK